MLKKLIFLFYIMTTPIYADYINKEGYYIVKNSNGEFVRTDLGLFFKNKNGNFENYKGTEYSVGPDLGNGKRAILSVVNAKAPVTITEWFITELILFGILGVIGIKLYRKLRRGFSPKY